MGMFNFFLDAGNYEERKIDNTKVNDAVIDTCRVSDSEKDYETGIAHPRYNKGKWIIVETYDTAEQAQEGHDKWRLLFESGLPEELVDVSSAGIKRLGEVFGGMDSIFKLT